MAETKRGVQPGTPEQIEGFALVESIIAEAKLRPLYDDYEPKPGAKFRITIERSLSKASKIYEQIELRREMYKKTGLQIKDESGEVIDTIRDDKRIFMYLMLEYFVSIPKLGLREIHALAEVEGTMMASLFRRVAEVNEVIPLEEAKNDSGQETTEQQQ